MAASTSRRMISPLVARALEVAQVHAVFPGHPPDEREMTAPSFPGTRVRSSERSSAAFSLGDLASAGSSHAKAPARSPGAPRPGRCRRESRSRSARCRTRPSPPRGRSSAAAASATGFRQAASAAGAASSAPAPTDDPTGVTEISGLPTSSVWPGSPCSSATVPAYGRGHLHHGLGRLHLGDRLVHADLVAHGHEPVHEFGFGEAFAEVRAAGILSVRSSVSLPTGGRQRRRGCGPRRAGSSARASAPGTGRRSR